MGMNWTTSEQVLGTSTISEVDGKERYITIPGRVLGQRPHQAKKLYAIERMSTTRERPVTEISLTVYIQSCLSISSCRKPMRRHLPLSAVLISAVVAFWSCSRPAEMPRQEERFEQPAARTSHAPIRLVDFSNFTFPWID